MEGIQKLGFHLPTLIIFMVNFLVLLGILYVFAYKPVLRMLDTRAGRIKESVEAAERAKQQAAQAHEEMQKQLAQARAEGQSLLEQARQQAEAYRREEQERARQQVEVYLQRARQEIQAERDAALDEVRHHFADLAVLAAERILERSVDRESHRRLIEKVLEESGTLRRS
ncbi:MAG: F0F1 ATP synthase subunit B [Chloroflexi bacterium]|nr:F0F1 ATP synthase subunit B [Chloroflexota bacterium]